MPDDAREPRPLTVEHLLLCEGVRYEGGGRPAFVGVISRGCVPRLPSTMDDFCVSVELWGPPDGRVPVTFRIDAPSGALVREEDVGVVALDSEGTRSFGGAFEGVCFEEEGLHRLSIRSRGRVLRSRRFLVEVEPSASRLTL